MSDSLNPTPDAEQLMFGAIPGKPALGRGPAIDGDYSRHPYHHPAAGWGAAESVANVLARGGRAGRGLRAIFVMNHEDGGFDCPGCAWPDDPKGLHLDICENGIKHVDLGDDRESVGPEFFAAHTVTELAGWSDFALERQGRLTEPMIYDPETRQIRARSHGTTRSRWSARRCAVWTARPGVLLHLRAAEQRGDVPLSALGARVRHEQPAGLLEHVPRGERTGADGGDRHRQGHR